MIVALVLRCLRENSCRRWKRGILNFMVCLEGRGRMRKARRDTAWFLRIVRRIVQDLDVAHSTYSVEVKVMKSIRINTYTHV